MRLLGAGAGVVGDLLSHGIDLAQFSWVRGSPRWRRWPGTFIPTRPLPLSVSVGHAEAPVSGERQEMENEDCAAAQARPDSGALVMVAST